MWYVCDFDLMLSACSVATSGSEFYYVMNLCQMHDLIIPFHHPLTPLNISEGGSYFIVCIAVS